MRNRIIVIIPALAYLCGCQSSDPYVRRSELRKESKQIAQAQTSQAMTALDEKYRASIDGLTSATDRNAESISTLESKSDTIAAQSAKSLSLLKYGLQADITANSNSIKQNTESISLLESTVNNFIRQSTQSVADVRSGLGQLEEQVAQFRLDVHREFAREEADRTETTDQLTEKTDQLAEKVNLLDNRLQKVLLAPAESLRPADRPEDGRQTTENRALSVSEGRWQTTEDRNSAFRHPSSVFGPPALSPSAALRINSAEGTEDLLYWRQGPYQLYFAVIGPLLMVSGPVLAELYARRQKRLARSLTRNAVQIAIK